MLQIFTGWMDDNGIDYDESDESEIINRINIEKDNQSKRK
jgi:hypothetical protein